MTIKIALLTIRHLGLTANTTPFGEIRVNLPPRCGGSEASAYYTNDPQDAVDTASAMLKEWQLRYLAKAVDLAPVTLWDEMGNTGIIQ